MHPTFLRGGSLAPAEKGQAETRWTSTTHPARSVFRTFLSLQRQFPKPTPSPRAPNVPFTTDYKRFQNKDTDRTSFSRANAGPAAPGARLMPSVQRDRALTSQRAHRGRNARAQRSVPRLTWSHRPSAGSSAGDERASRTWVQLPQNTHPREPRRGRTAENRRATWVLIQRLRTQLRPARRALVTTAGRKFGGDLGQSQHAGRGRGLPRVRGVARLHSGGEYGVPRGPRSSRIFLEPRRAEVGR